jgi:ribose transport system permease protein
MRTGEAAPPASGTSPAVVAAAPPSVGLRLARRVRERYSLVVLLFLVAVFSALHPTEFLSVVNARGVAVDASSYLVIAVGMTFVITVGGIDLSVGSVLIFAGVVALKVMLAIGGDSVFVDLVGLAVALAAGLGWGLVNGLVTTLGRIPPLISTLGSFAAAAGLANLLAGGQDMHGVPNSLADNLGYGALFGIPYTVLLALAVAAAGALLMVQTRFGRYTAAIGSNEEAARRAAIRVDRHLVKIYVLSGLLAGLAGFVSLARFQTTTLNGHQTDMLQAILAVVIGGTSLSGGVGTVLGTIVGVAIPSVLSAGFVILGLEPFWQQVALGVALATVVIVDLRNRRRRQLA